MSDAAELARIRRAVIDAYGEDYGGKDVAAEVERLLGHLAEFETNMGRILGAKSEAIERENRAAGMAIAKYSIAKKRAEAAEAAIERVRRIAQVWVDIRPTYPTASDAGHGVAFAGQQILDALGQRPGLQRDRSKGKRGGCTMSDTEDLRERYASAAAEWALMYPISSWALREGEAAEGLAKIWGEQIARYLTKYVRDEELERLRAELAEAREKHQADIASLQRLADRFREQDDRRYARVSAERDALKAERDAGQECITSLQSVLDELTAAAAEVASTWASDQAERDALKDRVEELEAKLILRALDAPEAPGGES